MAKSAGAADIAGAACEQRIDGSQLLVAWACIRIEPAARCRNITLGPNHTSANAESVIFGFGAKHNTGMKFSSDERLHFLDGLRGWGAVTVLLYHVFVDGFPINDGISSVLWRVFAFNGMLAIWVFFLVSGFSLAISFCRKRDSRALINIALGRCIRLAIPIFSVAFLLYLCFEFALILPADQRLPKFQGFMPIAPTFLDVIRFSFFDTFFAFNYSTALIVPLWTMPFELWGSCLVLGTLFVVGRLDRRFYAYAAVALLSYLIHPIYTAFIIGLLLAEFHVSGFWRRYRTTLSLVAAALVLPAIWWASMLLKDGSNQFASYLSIAVLLTVACVFNEPLTRLLSGRVSRFLGRISFPLYLIHGPLLLLYANRVYRWVGEPTDIQKVLLNLSTVAMSVLCATLLAPVDRWGISAAKRVSSYLIGRNGSRVPQAAEHVAK